jgi:hypothetical protein
MKFIWLISFIFGIINFGEIETSVNSNFIGERLIFKMEYLNLSVATLKFQIDSPSKNYHLKVHAKATLTARLLFKLDNVYETYFDGNSFLPFKAVKKIQQKNIQRELIINYYHQQQNKASVGDSVTWFIPGDCYDYFSMLYFLRNQELKPGDSISFHLDSEFLISKVEAKVLSDQEVIQVPAGKFKSITLKLKFTAINNKSRPWKTDLLTNRLASPGSEITIWFSDDDYRLPLKIAYDQSKIKTQLILESFYRGQQR